MNSFHCAQVLRRTLQWHTFALVKLWSDTSALSQVSCSGQPTLPTIFAIKNAAKCYARSWNMVQSSWLLTSFLCVSVPQDINSYISANYKHTLY